MKVLFASPYKLGPKYILGGIGVWARHVLDYSEQDDSISIIPVSLDRRVSATTLSERLYSGIKEYLKIIKEVYNKLKVSKPDVLHLCTSASLSLAKDLIILWLAKKQGVKTVIHYHFGRIPDIASKKKWEWKLLKLASKIADVSIVMDRKSYDVLKPLFGNKIENIPNPLSSLVLRYIDELRLTERDSSKIVFVGHVIPTKGIYELVEACKQIGGVQLQLVGAITESVKAEITKKAGANWDTWLMMTGEVGSKDVIKEMLSAGVFVLPSYTEGFPNVILESMACGCPIVATNVGAIPEMLNYGSDEECGICIPTREVEALRDALIMMLNDPSYSSQLSQRAIKRVNELYSMPIVWKQLKSAWLKTIQ